MGNIVNRVFDSSGPEGKVRGTPQQIIDKYAQLARDAQLSNDRVAAENFQQHAEHYTRMLGDALKEQEARREAQEAQNRNRQRDRDNQNAQSVGQPAEDPASMPQPGSEQPDIVDVPEGESALVETPESGGSAKSEGSGQKRGGRQRQPNKKAAGGASEGEAQEAAE